MKLYTNDIEWWAAEDMDDLRERLGQFHGEQWVDDLGEFREIPDDKQITFITDFYADEDDYVYITKTAKEWAETGWNDGHEEDEVPLASSEW